MDAHQESKSNPFGMDEECQNCPALCETRENVVHGYGDVGAEFIVLGDSPAAGPMSPASRSPARVSANCSTSSPQSTCARTRTPTGRS